MMSEGQIELEGSLDKAIYSHGEPVNVTVMINNRSHKTVKRVKVNITKTLIRGWKIEEVGN